MNAISGLRPGIGTRIKQLEGVIVIQNRPKVLLVFVPCHFVFAFMKFDQTSAFDLGVGTDFFPGNLRTAELRRHPNQKLIAARID
jgi:hypothetical protein